MTGAESLTTGWLTMLRAVGAGGAGAAAAAVAGVGASSGSAFFSTNAESMSPPSPLFSAFACRRLHQAGLTVRPSGCSSGTLVSSRTLETSVPKQPGGSPTSRVLLGDDAHSLAMHPAAWTESVQNIACFTPEAPR